MDAQVVWLDPRPYKDSQPGRRLRVDVVKGCPHSDGDVVGVTNSGTDLRAALVPSRIPKAGLICRYNGANSHAASLTLARRTRLTGPMAVTLALAARRLQLSHPDGQVIYCPDGDDEFTIIALRYPGRADVDLWYARTGCASVANGFITSTNSGAMYDAVATADPEPSR